MDNSKKQLNKNVLACSLKTSICRPSEMNETILAAIYNENVYDVRKQMKLWEKVMLTENFIWKKLEENPCTVRMRQGR